MLSIEELNLIKLEKQNSPYLAFAVPNITKSQATLLMKEFVRGFKAKKFSYKLVQTDKSSMLLIEGMDKYSYDTVLSTKLNTINKATKNNLSLNRFSDSFYCVYSNGNILPSRLTPLMDLYFIDEEEMQKAMIKLAFIQDIIDVIPVVTKNELPKLKICLIATNKKVLRDGETLEATNKSAVNRFLSKYIISAKRVYYNTSGEVKKESTSAAYKRYVLSKLPQNQSVQTKE